MKRNKLMIMVLLVFIASNQICAQRVEQDTLIQINRETCHIRKALGYKNGELLSQCKEGIDKINNMPLRGDTLIFRVGSYYDPFSRLIAAYFDSKGLLRKYVSYSNVNDGAHECYRVLAYYDEDGKSVYIGIDESNNCSTEMRHYYVNDGCIVDCEYDYDCGCCEDCSEDDDEEDFFDSEKIYGIRFATGSNVSFLADERGGEESLLGHLLDTNVLGIRLGEIRGMLEVWYY